MESRDLTRTHEEGATRSRLRFKERAFLWMLRGLRGGRLRVAFSSGLQATVGSGNVTLAELRIRSDAFFRKVVGGGSVGLGEAYVNGDWDSPDLSALLLLMARNQKELGGIVRGFSLLKQQMNRLYHRARKNTLEKSQENIQAHYDLSNEFYQCFLDPTMTYSSALFENREESLQRA